MGALKRIPVLLTGNGSVTSGGLPGVELDPAKTLVDELALVLVLNPL